MYDLFLSSFTNFVARLCTDSNILICFTLHGFQTGAQYSRTGLTKPFNTTLCFLPVKKLLIQLYMFPSIPYDLKAFMRYRVKGFGKVEINYVNGNVIS